MNFYSFCSFSLKLRRLARLQFRTYIRLMISLVRDSWRPTTDPSPLLRSVKFEVTRRDSRSPRPSTVRENCPTRYELLSRTTVRIYMHIWIIDTSSESDRASSRFLLLLLLLFHKQELRLRSRTLSLSSITEADLHHGETFASHRPREVSACGRAAVWTSLREEVHREESANGCSCIV